MGLGPDGLSGGNGPLDGNGCNTLEMGTYSLLVNDFDNSGQCFGLVNQDNTTNFNESPVDSLNSGRHGADLYVWRRSSEERLKIFFVRECDRPQECRQTREVKSRGYGCNAHQHCRQLRAPLGLEPSSPTFCNLGKDMAFTDKMHGRGYSVHLSPKSELSFG